MTEDAIKLCGFVVLLVVIGIVLFLILHPSTDTASSGTSLASIAGYLFSP